NATPCEGTQNAGATPLMGWTLDEPDGGGAGYARADRTWVPFRNGETCPICGGSEDEKRGGGERCLGGATDDGELCRCTRVESGKPSDSSVKPGWLHILRG